MSTGPGRALSTPRRRWRDGRRDESAWGRGFQAGERVATQTRDELDAWLLEVLDADGR